MKRYLAVLLLLSLLMTACSHSPAEPETAPQTETAAPSTTVPAEPVTKTLLKSHTIEQNIAGMTIQMRSDYTYDENGFMTEIIQYANDQETGRTTVECDQFGSPIRQTSVSQGITTVTTSECTYDENGILLRKIDTVTANGQVTETREYAYTAHGKVLEATFTRLGDNGYITGNRYEYDDQGCQIAEVFLGSDGSEAREETTYNEKGDPIRSVTTNSDGVVTIETDYTYLEDGSVKAVSGQSWSLTTYNDQGNPLVQETYTGDELTLRMTYEYITVPVS